MAAVFLFQNESLVAVDKPAGVLSVPPRFPDERRILGRELEVELGRQIFPVHRLDFEVSGIILYALTPQAHKLLNRAFENSELQKTYTAFTDTDVLRSEWTQKQADLLPDVQLWKSKIERGKKRSFASPRGQEARTEAEWLGLKGSSDRPYYEWRLRPLTGRPHQLRFELAQRGYPIWGDHLYGSKLSFGAENHIALRAVSIEFPKALRESFGLPDILRAEALHF